MTETEELALRCLCGTVRGVAREISPRTINRCICYCDDCQAFAHFLGRQDDLLDAWGGSEVVQMSQARVALTAGLHRVAAMRLTEKGLMRWYAGCCNTPIGNTLATPSIPFIGLLRVFIDAPSEALGPIRGRAFAQYAKGGRAAVPKDGSSDFAMLVRMVPKLLGWRLRGDHRRSPLFDAANRPLVEPRVLDPAEREELRRAQAAWRNETPAGG